MKRHIISLVAVLAVGWLLAGPANAGGRVIYRNPFTIAVSEVDETCNGDVVEISGLLRHDVLIVIDAAGGLHSTYTIRATLKGVSESGTTYLGSGVNTGSEYFAPDETPANGTFVDGFRLISNDGTPNLRVRALFHITVSPTGEITTFTQDLDVVCG